jgi:hypothetical protein
LGLLKLEAYCGTYSLVRGILEDGLEVLNFGCSGTLLGRGGFTLMLRFGAVTMGTSSLSLPLGPSGQ